MASPSGDTNLRGKIAVVTGANTGIGRATALKLAQYGAHVILACRSKEKTESVVADIKAKCGHENVEFMSLDLSSIAKVRQFAEAFLSRNLPLDILVNNAGVITRNRQESVDGNELMFATNHLGPFLLTHLLLPALRRSRSARIVIVASEAHKFGPLYLEDLQSTLPLTPWRLGFMPYGRSKLANMLFGLELDRRLRSVAGINNITVTWAHPGTVRSDLGSSETPWYLKWLIAPIQWLFFKTPEQGAVTQVWLASSPEMEGKSGEYYIDCKPARPKEWATDLTVAKKLWELSEKLVGLKEDEKLRGE